VHFHRVGSLNLPSDENVLLVFCIRRGNDSFADRFSQSGKRDDI
jgi:hypothetical protein